MAGTAAVEDAPCRLALWFVLSQHSHTAQVCLPRDSEYLLQRIWPSQSTVGTIPHRHGFKATPEWAKLCLRGLQMTLGYVKLTAEANEDSKFYCDTNYTNDEMVAGDT